MTGPLVALVFRQAARIRKQADLIAERERTIDELTAALERIRMDVDLLACCIHPSKRRDALALVRDRRRIEGLTAFEEADW